MDIKNHWKPLDSREMGVRSSVDVTSRAMTMPGGASRQVRYGDRIFVRLVNLQQGWRTIAEFELDNVADMSDIYGELRYRTRGMSCLSRLYVRNATRGWSFEQPFKLYAGQHPAPAASVTHSLRQPAGKSAGQPVTRQEILESIRTFDL